MNDFIVDQSYGSNSFNEATMRERLPKRVFKELKKVQQGKQELTLEVAAVVANTMKDWAIEKGASHYTHWFQPLTGLTAEKHDSFISPEGDGTCIMEFSGKELVQGEPDASSFPSGGIRATFEARGYTAWDTTSPAFLKQDQGGLTLCIPTAFVSYTGEALDKKVPLLRSMNAISIQSVRVLKALGDADVTRVTTSIGPEQEYFLIDKDFYYERPDLLLTGRTLFGTMSAKGQEMDDHYFGAIKERVADYMRELNQELWKMGISAKTQHNEVAPGQFELATIYDTSNVSTDTNQLVMETMRTVAARKELVCLLHEKPFAGVNGSGKHNNWSLGTDTGRNLLEPGKTPHENAEFLLFLAATIKAVDVYAPLLRATAANSGNDHRLGANEAPPAVISIFLGSQINQILEDLSEGKIVKAKEGGKLELGVNSLPKFPLDVSDRNRTSPFAFTGNKFEFRMPASSQSIAGPSTALNTAVAEVLADMADRLEKASDANAELQKIVAETFKAHKRVIFNGNGYSDEWLKEAEKRGLPNLKSTVECLPELTSPEVIRIFEKHKVLSKVELESREEIYLEVYSQQINIEAGVMVEMADKQIYPAVSSYMGELATTAQSLKELGVDAETQIFKLKVLAEKLKGLKAASEKLAVEKAGALETEGSLAQAKAYREKVFVAMSDLREYGDALETLTDRDLWPFPSYEDMLFKL
ncbi:MAG: glutamine synthetase III [Spirochaetaceae bacterium]|jgi:glutamine synthetase|nr:glutamine synthetase III [Spirochaetaceae bacterium]